MGIRSMVRRPTICLQLAHLALQRFDALRLASSFRRRSPASIAPASQRVGIDSDALPDPAHRRIQRQLRIPLPGLGNKPHRTLTMSCGYFLGAGMIRSSRGIRPSTRPGAIHRRGPVRENHA